MPSLPAGPAGSQSPVAEAVAKPQRMVAPDHETHNFVVLAAHQVAVRVGWIFKTESIIVPAFLDAVGGTGWMRGLLPVLNRFGHSVPPVVMARRVKLAGCKKWLLATFTLGMAMPFLLVSICWAFGPAAAESNSVIAPWWPWFFLAAYGAFFVATGLNQLAAHTLQGKLIRANYRGRLMTTGIVVGAPLAIASAFVLLPDWLASNPVRFDFVFGMTSALMMSAAVCALFLKEPRDSHDDEKTSLKQQFQAAWDVLRHDGRFRRLAAVAALFGVVMMLFPHYQAVGRQSLKLDITNLMWWVVIQNAGTMLCSLLAGPVADRFGNRAALHITILGSAMTPILAVVLANLPADVAGKWYWIVFPSIGLTPVTTRLLVNYTLELTTVAQQPRYVSTLGLCVAVPVVVGAPLAGWLVDAIGFSPVLLTGAALIGLAGLLTFALAEPRHD